MKIARLLTLSVCSSLTTALLCHAAAAAADRTAQATAFVELLAAGKFAAAIDTFDTTMRGALPEEKLRGVWNGLATQSGPFVKHSTVRTERIGAYDVVLVTCEFERAVLDAKVVFDGNGKVAGLFFLPSTNANAFAPPPYASRDTFDEVDITFGEEPWVLPGTISLPKGDGPFPGVVLVHGSGPQDRDETVGANKPFRDIAWGLASRGIAVLRYEKRTKQHADKLTPVPKDFTVKEETVSDAAAAFEALKSSAGINPKEVYILGHSLGGTLAPRVAEYASGIAGCIILAGATRALEWAVIDQTEYIAKLDGKITEDEQKHIDAITSEMDTIMQIPAWDTENTKIFFGAPARYWIDLHQYDPARAAGRTGKPFLVMQGGRDYQVTGKDFQLWAHNLAHNKEATFWEYPDLNHLFMKGSGPSSPSEYEQPGHVDQQVIDQIADWIKNPSKVRPEHDACSDGEK